MSRTQYVLAFVAGTLWLGGLAMILVLGQHDNTLSKVGACVVGLGAGLWYAALGRRARPLLVIGLLTALLFIGWAVVRYGGSDDPEPTATDAPHADAELTSAEALAQGIEWLRASIKRMRGFKGYTLTFAKRERAKSILGKVRLTDELLEMKVRHTPFSVYVKYRKPEAKEGTEAIYVAGANEGKLLAHSSRQPLKMLGTMRLEPTDWRAMIDQRYPITRAGLAGMAEECLRVAQADAEQLERCEVRLLERPEVAGRPCYGFEIENPDADSGYELALIRVVFDEEWHAPVFTERWHYLDVDGERKRLLVEQYTTTNLVLDPGLTDKDFDPGNPEYGY